MARRSHRLAYAPESRDFLEDSQRLVGAGWRAPMFPRKARRIAPGRSLTWTESDSIVQSVALTAPGRRPSGDVVEAFCSAHPRAPGPAAAEPADTVAYFVSPDSGVKRLLPPPTSSMQDVHAASELSPEPDNPGELLPPGTATPLAADWGSLEEEDAEAKRNIAGVWQRHGGVSPFGSPFDAVAEPLPRSSSEDADAQPLRRLSSSSKDADAHSVANPRRVRVRADSRGKAHEKIRGNAAVHDSVECETPVQSPDASSAPKMGPGFFRDGAAGLNQFSASAERKTMLLKARSQRSFKQVQQKFAKDWRKDRDAVEDSRKRYRLAAAMCGFCGTVAACMQHELVLRGFAPLSLMVNITKFVSTCFSCVLIGLLYRVYHLDVLFERIRLHLRLLVPLNIKIEPQWILCQGTFWFEAIILFIHLPPFVTFEYGTLNWNNFILYRAETMFAVWNSLRCYLFWRCYVDWQLKDLPRKHTVASFTGVRLNSSFTFKQVLNSDQAVAFIACLWASLLLLLGYWFRAAELTACQFGYPDHLTAEDERCAAENAMTWKVWLLNGEFFKTNDNYLWNGAWSIFSATTTVGFGDVLATTHCGRIVAALSNIVGLTMAAMLTSSFMFRMQFTPAEVSGNLMLEKEKANQNLQLAATRFLQSWFRQRQQALHNDKLWMAGKLVDSLVAEGREAFRRHELHVMKQAFRQTRATAREDFQDMLADSVKVDQLAARTRDLCGAIEDITRRTDPNYVYDSDEEMTEWEQEMKAKARANKKRTADLLRNAFKRKGTLHALYTAVIDAKNHNQLPEADDQGNLTKDEKLVLAIKESAKIVRAPRRKWRRNRDKVEKRIVHNNLWAAIFGVLGTISSAAQQELVVRNVSPASFWMNVFKCSATIFTVLCVHFVYQIYWTNILHRRLNTFLRRGVPMDDDVPASEVFKSGWFWLECVVCVLHCPPFFTSEWANESMSNIVVYRIETLMCSWTVIRVYLIWRALADYMIQDLPSKHNIAAYAGIEFDSRFVLKKMLNSWYAVFWIAGFFNLFVVIAGYVFRMAEHSHSCLFEHSSHPLCSKESARTWIIFGREFTKENDLYLLNSAWFIFTSMIPGSGGNVLIATHFGRCVGAAAVLSGVIIASLTTAALGNLMMFNPTEHTAIGVMNREKHRVSLMIGAANVIALWWRKRRNQKKITYRQRKMDMYGYRREFVAAQRMIQVEVEECASTSTKIDQITKRTKHMEVCMEQIGMHLFHKAISPQGSPRARRRSSRTSSFDPHPISRTSSLDSSVDSREGIFGRS